MLKPLTSQVIQLRTLAWRVAPDEVAGMSRSDFVDALVEQAWTLNRDTVQSWIHKLKELDRTAKEGNTP